MVYSGPEGLSLVSVLFLRLLLNQSELYIEFCTSSDSR